MVKKLSLFLMAVMAMFLFAGCKPPERIFKETDHFIFEVKPQYEDHKNENGRYDVKYEYLVCIRITEEGRRHKRLEVPNEVDGLPVMELGIESNMFSGWEEKLESENLETIYLPKNVKAIRRSTFSPSPNLKTVLCERAEGGVFAVSAFYNSNVNISGYVPYNALQAYYNNSMQYVAQYPANVTYKYNYEGAENINIYRIDNVEKGSKISEPPVPLREGYKFAGWYKDSECTNSWDFALDITEHGVADKAIHEMEDLNLETFGTILYAKWEEIK